MPATPVIWRPTQLVNTVTSGNQYDPNITQLSNGNILVTWTSDDPAGAGSAEGLDIIGQIYDPLGNAIGTEFRVNNFIVDDESDASIAGLTNGGFVSVYIDHWSAGATTDIRLAIHDASGGIVTSATVASSDGTYIPEDPQVAVSSSTSGLVAWIDSATTSQLHVSGFNPTTGVLGTDNFVFQNATGDGDIRDLDITALTNGTYVVVSTFSAGADDRIAYSIISSNGAVSSGLNYAGTTNGNGEDDNDPTVVALTGGGFAIAWVNQDINDTDVMIQVFNSSGTAVTTATSVNGGSATNNNNEPQLAALSDGGFIVFYDDDVSPYYIRGQRYSATGAMVGTEFLVTTGGASSVSATLLGDGRVAVVWSDGEIQMQIIDTRDIPSTGDYNPDWQIGTGGNDNFSADGSSLTVHGWDGDDVITEAGQIRSYFGGDGNDLILVNSVLNSDYHNGGNGNDTISFLGSGVFNLQLDLSAGTATDGFSTETVVEFENAVGTNNADVITGSNAANFIWGEGGFDTIDGGAGQDTLYGHGGNDSVLGGTDDDLIYGNDGNDTLYGGWGTDTVYGDDGNDLVVIQSGDGLDDADGGTGNDTLSYAGTDGFITFALATGVFSYSGVNRVAANFENYIDGEGSGSITGTAGDNVMSGEGGNDTIFGYGGNDSITGGDGGDELRGNAGTDTLSGGAGADSVFGGENDDLLGGEGGNDILDGGTGNDAAYGGAGNDQILGSAGNDTLNGGADYDTADYSAATDNLVVNINFAGAQAISASMGTDLLAGIEGVEGGSGNDLLVGNAGGNILNGNGGSDELYGLAGADVLNGGGGNDLIEGSGGNDTMDGGAGIDTLNYYNAAGGVTVNLNNQGSVQAVGGSMGNDLFANFENLIGSNGFADTLIGSAGNNAIYGQGGNDTIYGGAGNDSLYGMQGNDALVGGGGADLLVGGAGDDFFDFNAVGESAPGTRDTIQDFGVGNDIISLETIDANTTVAGNQAFVYIGAAGFTAAGQVRFITNGTDGFLLANVDAALGADFEVRLIGVTALPAVDLIL